MPSSQQLIENAVPPASNGPKRPWAEVKAEIHAKSAAAKKLASELASARSVRFKSSAGRGDILVTPSTREPGKFQLTWFTRPSEGQPGEPWGHANYPTMEDAALSAMGQFTKSNGPPHGDSTYRPSQILPKAAAEDYDAELPVEEGVSLGARDLIENELAPEPKKLRKYRVTVTTDVKLPSRVREVEASSFRRAFEKVAERPSSEFNVRYTERHAIPTRSLNNAVSASFSGRTLYARVDLLESEQQCRHEFGSGRTCTRRATTRVAGVPYCYAHDPGREHLSDPRAKDRRHRLRWSSLH